MRRTIKVTGSTSVAFSPDGKALVTGGGNGELQIWGVHSGTLLRTLKGQAGMLGGLAYSPDGKTIAGGSSDKTIRVWDAETGQLLRTLSGSGGPISALSFSTNGKVLASGGSQDVARGNLRATLRYPTAEEIKNFKLNGDPPVVAADVVGDQAEKEPLKKNDIIQKINEAEITGRNVFYSALTNHKPGAEVTLSILREGKPLEVKVTLGEGKLTTGEIKLWDVASGKVTQTFTGQSPVVRSVAFSPDGKTLVSAGTDKVVRLWDATTGTLLRSLTGHSHTISAVAFSPDGKTVASASGSWPPRGVSDFTVRLWDAPTGTLLHTLTGHKAQVLSVAFSPDGKTVASGGTDKTVKLWDTQTGQEKRMLGRDATVFSLTDSPDKRTLVASTGEGSVLLWDVQSGELTRTLTHTDIVYSSVFSPDGKMLATAGRDRIIKLWDAQSGALMRTLEGHSDWISRVAFSADGKVLLSESWDHIVKLWEVESGKLLRSLTASSWASFSPDGKVLVTSNDDGTVKLYNAENAELLRALPVSGLIAFLPDGKTFLGRGRDGAIKLWDIETGTSRSEALQNPLFGTTAMETWALSPDGKIVAGGTVRAVYLWDAQSGKRLRSLMGHSGTVHSLCFLQNGKILASGGEDQIKLWDTATGRLLATLYALPPQAATKSLTADARALSVGAKALTADAKTLTADARDIVTTTDYLVVTPEGYYMGSAAADRYVRFRLGNDSFPAESFQARYYRPDLVKQALAGKELPPVGEFKGPVPPLLAFTSPEPQSKVSGETATVTVETSDDSDVKSIAFFVNGSRIDAKPITADARPLIADAKALSADSKPLIADSRDIPQAHKLARRFTSTIPLPRDDGSIKVQAIAFDDDGLQSPRQEILFTRDKTAKVAGKLLGLCVGVSRYQDPRLNLKFADADATALTETLNQQRGTYSAASVAALTNEQATRESVKAALDKLIAQTTRDDTVMLLLSGHGWRGDERSFYFATHEVNHNDVANTALPWSDVVQRLTQLSQKSKRVIVLLDACHSGSAASNEELVKAILGANAGVMVFASSKGSEVSLENAEWEHGAFTKALLEAIEGKAAIEGEKSVSLWDFANYVRRRVKLLTEGTQNPQTPFWQDFDTDAAIVAQP